MAVAPELYPDIEGSTDSELLFHLALTFGLQDDPPSAVARAVGLVEESGRRHGVEHPIQMTIATNRWVTCTGCGSRCPKPTMWPSGVVRSSSCRSSRSHPGPPPELW